MSRTPIHHPSFRGLLHKRQYIILGLLIVHLAIPLLFGKVAIGYDGVQYLQYAKNLITHGFYTYDGINSSCGRAPGYPVFLAVFLWLFGSHSLVYPIQLLLLFASYYLIVRSFSRALPESWQLALLTFFVALWPLNRIALSLMSEPLFIFISSVGLYYLTRFQYSPQRRYLFLFAAVMTLSAYIRPVSTLFVFFVAVTAILFLRMRWRMILGCVLISAAMLAPWTFRNWQEFGKFIPVASTYGSVYYMTDQEEFETIILESAGASHSKPAYLRNVADDFELDPPANDRFLQEAKQNIARDPVGFLKRCVLKTIFIWSYLPGTKKYLKEIPPLFYAGVALQICFLVCTTAGGYLLHRRRHPVFWPVASFAVYHVLFLFPFYAESRYLIPVYIWLVGLSAYSLRQLIKRMARQSAT